MGKALLRQAADNVMNSSMELGGNGPFIVFDDAEIEQAVEGAMVAKLRNGGESRVAANRIFVHRSVADEFVSRFALAWPEFASAGARTANFSARNSNRVDRQVSGPRPALVSASCGGDSPAVDKQVGSGDERRISPRSNANIVLSPKDAKGHRQSRTETYTETPPWQSHITPRATKLLGVGSELFYMLQSLRRPKALSGR